MYATQAKSGLERPHTKAIAVYEKNRPTPKTRPLEIYARYSLPTLELHLDAAKELEKKR